MGSTILQATLLPLYSAGFQVGMASTTLTASAIKRLSISGSPIFFASVIRPSACTVNSTGIIASVLFLRQGSG